MAGCAPDCVRGQKTPGRMMKVKECGTSPCFGNSQIAQFTRNMRCRGSGNSDEERNGQFQRKIWRLRNLPADEVRAWQVQPSFFGEFWSICAIDFGEL